MYANKERGRCAVAAVSSSRPVPLYWQLAQELQRMIAEGELKQGDKLPTEQWLHAHYHVSRVTVRRAIQHLLDEGILKRSRGKSPTVELPHMNRQTSHLSGLSADLCKMGYHPTSLVLCCEEMQASSEVSTGLGLQPGEAVFHLTRLRLADNVPLAIHDSFYPVSRCGAFLSAPFQAPSVYGLLEENGLRPTHARQTVSACNAGGREAQLLSLPLHSALLHIIRISSTPDGLPIEYSEMFYNPRHYSLNMELDC